MSEANGTEVQTEKQTTQRKTEAETQPVNVPDGYIPKDEFDRRFQQKFDEHRDEFMKRGMKNMARKLGLNPDTIDYTDERAVKKALEQKRDLEQNLDEERVDKLKQEIHAEYEPVKQELETYKNRMAELQILGAAKDAGFQDDVVNGEWKNEFIRDVRDRTTVLENGERVMIDEKGNPLPSPDPQKTYQNVNDLLQEMTQKSRWSVFATRKAQKSDSGFNEGSRTEMNSKGRKKSDYESRVAFIREGGTAKEWINMPD